MNGKTAKQKRGVQTKAKELKLSKAQMADLLENTIKSTLTVFCEKHNSAHPVKLDHKITTNFQKVENDNKIVAKVSLELQISMNGIWQSLYRKSYGLTHISQIEDTGEFLSSLFSDLLLNLVGFSILASIGQKLENWNKSEATLRAEGKKTPENY